MRSPREHPGPKSGGGHFFTPLRVFVLFIFALAYHISTLSVEPELDPYNPNDELFHMEQEEMAKDAALEAKQKRTMADYEEVLLETMSEDSPSKLRGISNAAELEDTTTLLAGGEAKKEGLIFVGCFDSKHTTIPRRMEWSWKEHQGAASHANPLWRRCWLACLNGGFNAFGLEGAQRGDTGYAASCYCNPLGDEVEDKNNNAIWTKQECKPCTDDRHMQCGARHRVAVHRFPPEELAHTQNPTEKNGVVWQKSGSGAGTKAVVRGANELKELQRSPDPPPVELRSTNRPETSATKAKKKRRYAVMGLAAGSMYGRPIKEFVNSLRLTGYDGEIVLGVTQDVKDQLKDFIQKHKVTAILVASHKCHDPGMGDNCGNIEVGGWKGEAAMNLARFQEYKEWSKMFDDDDVLMITDVRDVYFQQNPFPMLHKELDEGYDVFVFEEVEEPWSYLGWNGTFKQTDGTIATKWNFNRGWIWACWGKDAVDKLKKSHVLCSGTTIATKKGLTRYLGVMLSTIAERVAYTDKKHCPGWMDDKCDCRSGGIDQGMHNYLYHIGRFGSGATQIKNARGVVYTVGYICERPDIFDKDALKLDSEGMVVIPGGGKAAVVHQADRCNTPKGWQNSENGYSHLG
jgi:hypothetical protein